MTTDIPTTYWWLLLIVNSFSSVLLAGFVLRWRYLLLKPSILFLTYYQLSVMWPALTWYDTLVELVPDMHAYFIALHVFGLLATIVGVVTWHRSARRLSRRILSAGRPALPQGPVAPIILTAVLASIAGWYLMTVGWHNTGLYAILSQADGTAQAREESLKLISSSALRYAWSISTCSVAYVLAYLYATRCARALRHSRFLTAGMLAAAYTLVLLMVILPGSRAPAALVILTTLFAYYVSTGFRLSPAIFCFVAALALVAPALLSLLREHQNLTVGNLAIYYADIFDRVAGRSVEDNIWMVGYSQDHGFFGSAGIPVLAQLAGIEPVNIFNVVGLHFRPNGIQSISANASFPAVNYACFGPAALGVSLVLTFAMDALLWLQSGLPRCWLIPCCGICVIISMNFAMTMFTTVFITHGLIPTVFVCYGLLFINELLNSPRPTVPAASTILEN